MSQIRPPVCRETLTLCVGESRDRLCQRPLRAAALAALWLAVVLTACHPASPAPAVTPPSTAALPPDFTLLPAFTPAYPCELREAEVYDADLCRSERVRETAAARGAGVLFILREYHLGTGCYGSINVDTRELLVCDQHSGAVRSLTGSGPTERITSALIPSPDSTWLAFTTLVMGGADAGGGAEGAAIRPRVYRVSADGARFERLDTAGLPDFAVGAQGLRWTENGAWLELSLWDGGTDTWHACCLRADGSGLYVLPRSGSPPCDELPAEAQGLERPAIHD